MTVEVQHSLPRGWPAVHTNVIAIRLKLSLNQVFGLDQELREVLLLGWRKGEVIGPLGAGNDK
jgi:hypothetical protein